MGLLSNSGGIASVFVIFQFFNLFSVSLASPTTEAVRHGDTAPTSDTVAIHSRRAERATRSGKVVYMQPQVRVAVALTCTERQPVKRFRRKDERSTKKSHEMSPELSTKHLNKSREHAEGQ